MKIMKTRNLIVLGMALLSTAVISIACSEGISQDNSSNLTSIVWHDISELEALQNSNPKKVIVDVYTDWCKWCKVMDEKTFSDPNFIKHVSSEYHMVKLDAELAVDLRFKEKTYSFIKQGRRGYHELARELSQGQLSYPSFVLLDNDLNVLDVTRGFKDTPTFIRFLEKAAI